MQILKNVRILIICFTIIWPLDGFAAQDLSEREGVTGGKFSKLFGGENNDFAFSVHQTDDGGFIVAGGTESFGSGGMDIWLIKIDSEGRKVWDKTFGGQENDLAYALTQTSDRGFLLSGYTQSFGQGRGDVWLIRTDSEGNELWAKTFGGKGWDEAYWAYQTDDNGFIVTGRTKSFGQGDWDTWLIKIDREGNKLWDKRFGGKEHNLGYSVQPTTDGGFFIVGGKIGKIMRSTWLLKTDHEGNKLWENTLYDKFYNAIYAGERTHDDGMILAGRVSDGGTFDVWLIKTDKDGHKVWDKTFGGKDEEQAYAVRQTTDRGFIVAGSAEGIEGRELDIWLIRTDETGNALWNKVCGKRKYNTARSVQQTTDGGFIVVGSTSEFGTSDFDVWLMKTDAQGEVE